MKSPALIPWRREESEEEEPEEEQGVPLSKRERERERKNDFFFSFLRLANLSPQRFSYDSHGRALLALHFLLCARSPLRSLKSTMGKTTPR